MTEEEINHELNKLEINKSPGNDSLTKNSMKPFGIMIKLLSFCHLKWFL